VEEYYRDGQATDDNVGRAHCVLINYGTHSEYVILLCLRNSGYTMRHSVALYVPTFPVLFLCVRKLFVERTHCQMFT